MLKRNIGVFQGVVLAVGMVLGSGLYSGLYSLPGMAIELGGAGLALLSWGLMMSAMIPMLMVFIRLGQAYPQADGLAQYAVVAMAGDAQGSLRGSYAKAAVAILLCGTFVLGLPATAWVAAAYVLHALGVTEPWLIACLTVAFLVLSVVLNLRGVQVLAKVNAASLYVLLFIMTVLFLMNLTALQMAWHVVGERFIVSDLWTEWQAVDLRQLWAVMALLFWAFLGWENMSFGLGELRDPQRNVPRVYGYSFVVVCLLYLLLAMLCSGLAWQGRDVSGATGLLVLFPSPVTRFVFGVTLALMIVASMNAWVFGASRLIYSTRIGWAFASFFDAFE